MLATLLLSQGVPMLLMGDEVGRTQRGNNNGYCQDNETSWMDWELSPASDRLLAFVRQLVEWRKRHPAFERQTYYRGERVQGSWLRDVTWFRTDGQEMTPDDWNSPRAASLALLIDGQATDERDAMGRPVTDDLFCVVFNAEPSSLRYTLPSLVWRLPWEVVLDTSAEAGQGQLSLDARSGRVVLGVPPRSVVLLSARRDPLMR